MDRIARVIVCMLFVGLLGCVSAIAIPGNDIKRYSNPEQNRPFGYENDTGSHGFGGSKGTFTINTVAYGQGRQYKLYVPQACKDTVPAPLLIHLHSFGSNMDEGLYFWKSLADSLGFIITDPMGDYDDGAGHMSWREIYDHTSGYYMYDTALVMKIINETIRSYNVDLSKIWVSGFSDGASLALRQATELSWVLSASCPQSPSWNPLKAPPGDALRKTPIFIRVGEDDSLHFDDYCRDAEIAFLAAGWVKDVNWKLDIIQGFGHNWHSQSCQLFLDWVDTHPLPHNWIRPTVSFNYPASGDQWTTGSTETIDYWVGCGNGPYDITFEYSADGTNGPWELVGSTTIDEYGNYVYDWTIPTSVPETPNAALRAAVTDSSSPPLTNTTTMDYTFEILNGAMTPDGMPIILTGVCISVVGISYWISSKQKR